MKKVEKEFTILLDMDERANGYGLRNSCRCHSKKKLRPCLAYDKRSWDRGHELNVLAAVVTGASLTSLKTSGAYQRAFNKVDPETASLRELRESSP